MRNDQREKRKRWLRRKENIMAMHRVFVDGIRRCPNDRAIYCAAIEALLKYQERPFVIRLQMPPVHR